MPKLRWYNKIPERISYQVCDYCNVSKHHYVLNAALVDGKNKIICDACLLTLTTAEEKDTKDA